MFYDYKCPKCGEVVEKQHGMQEKPVYKCEKCDEELKQVISGGGATIFKGTDFYCKSYMKQGSWGD